MMKKALQSIKQRWHTKWKPWFLKCWRLVIKILKFVKYFWADVDHRRCSLVGAGILGVVLAYIVSCLTSIFGLDNKTLQSSITIFALGLPIFYVLWVFRTYDVQEQIDKVQKQIDKTEEDTNNSTFFECARMLAEEKSLEHDSLSKKTALEQLAYLKEETGFDKKRIDSLTRGLDLIKKIFNLARFSGLDLSKAILNEAELNEADLTGAELNEADLANAELNDANLANVKLNGADLTRAELNDAKLNGAELIGANLRGANLTRAELIFANLSNVDLTRADLNDAKLYRAKLIKADLIGANLSRADLNDANLTGAIYDSKTKFIGTILEDKEMRDKEGMEYRPGEPE